MDKERMKECVDYGCKRWMAVLSEMEAKKMVDINNPGECISVLISIIATIQGRVLTTIAVMHGQEMALRMVEDVFLEIRKKITDLDKKASESILRAFHEFLSKK